MVRTTLLTGRGLPLADTRGGTTPRRHFSLFAGA